MELGNLINDSSITLSSAAMQEIYQQVTQVAPLKATVLITGETGVGKEIVTQKIHRLGSRRHKPLIAVNCSTFPDNSLLQSELFGHEKGAFTGATSQRRGLFEKADTGTLFLDEIGEMPLEVQAMLLRVLETQEFTRLGGSEHVRTDARLIAATNKDLENAVEDRTFRQDLYYRINEFVIYIPPLRERSEDILPLVSAFIDEFSAAYHKQIMGITPAVLHYLKNAPWPGNIRELRNAVSKTMIRMEKKIGKLDLEDLPADIGLIRQTGLEKDTRKKNISLKMTNILARLSLLEFIFIFGGIPGSVWRHLPQGVQDRVVQAASFHLAELFGGHVNAVEIGGKDRNQILADAARLRMEQHGSLSAAAKSLGIDRRTLKVYLERNK